MDKHTIEISVLPGGKIKAEVKGIKGSACSAISQWLDKLGEVIEHRPTKEMYEKATAKVIRYVRGQ